MPEARTRREGIFRMVAASGSGRTWATASAPVNHLMGLVRDFTFSSAQTITTIDERGTPDHHKITSVDPISLTLQFLWTGQFPTGASGSGASVPMFHTEFRAAQPELNNSGAYMQFHGCAIKSVKFSERVEGNTIDLEMVALAMNGATGSGYLG